MDAPQLTKYLQEIWDSEYSSFQGWPESLEIGAKRFSNIMLNYYSSMVVPVGGKSVSTLMPAIKTFESSFLLASKGQILKTQLEILLTILHLQICTGVTSLQWITVPKGVLSLKSCYLQNKYEGKAITVCKKIANEIDKYVHSTTSTHAITGVTVNWK